MFRGRNASSFVGSLFRCLAEALPPALLTIHTVATPLSELLLSFFRTASEASDVSSSFSESAER